MDNFWFWSIGLYVLIFFASAIVLFIIILGFRLIANGITQKKKKFIGFGIILMGGFLGLISYIALDYISKNPSKKPSKKIFIIFFPNSLRISSREAWILKFILLFLWLLVVFFNIFFVWIK